MNFRICFVFFSNPFNRERHERNIHGKGKSCQPNSSAASNNETPSTSNPSPAMTRRRARAKNPPVKKRGQIFDFERKQGIYYTNTNTGIMVLYKRTIWIRLAKQNV